MKRRQYKYERTLECMKNKKIYF